VNVKQRFTNILPGTTLYVEVQPEDADTSVHSDMDLILHITQNIQ